MFYQNVLLRKRLIKDSINGYSIFNGTKYFPENESKNQCTTIK